MALNNKLLEHNLVEYYSNGNKKYESYYIKNKRHKLDGPAVIWYFENGKVARECYYIEGNIHRLDGPAVTVYDVNGNIEYEYYFINDTQYLINEWNAILRQEKLKYLN